jgi:hypothetical protein
VCGFNALSTVTFKVNGHDAGTAQADSNGCVQVVVSFYRGKVSVNANAPIKVHAGLNFLIVEGHKTSGGVTQVVGLKLPFSTPPPGHRVCPAQRPQPTVPTSLQTPPPTGGAPTSIPGRLTTTTFPVRTTIHGYYPTTLAKALETPLEISPNKVILESSLLAAVLAAVLSAGALGAIWSAGEGEAGAAAVGAGAGAAAGAGEGETPGEPGGSGAPPPPPPPGPAAPAGGGAAAAPPGAQEPSAFQRTAPDGPPQGGGGA